MYQVEVIYSAKYYPEMDAVLRKAIGSYSHASGMGFGERDASWYYKTKKAAQKAYKAAKKIKNVTVGLNELDDDDEDLGL